MDHLLMTWGYLALFAITMISSLGIPIGSELAMGFGGALASGQVGSGSHHLTLGAVILVAVAGELVGSLIGYGIGIFGGRPLVDRLGKYVLLTHRDLDRAERWIARRGDPFVLFGRLVPLLRSFVSVAAGLGEMVIVRFLIYTVLGSAIFCATLISIGYALGASWHHVVKDFSYAGYVAAVLAVLVVGAAVYLRVRTLRAEREDRPQALHARRPRP
ncbi:MAG: DedA family protein [Acidimicrobiales bacterium]